MNSLGKNNLLLSVLMTGALLSACGPSLDAKDVSAEDYKVTTLTDKLVKPWGIAALPNGDYFVTEIGGTAKIISGNKVTNVNGLPENIVVGGQGGLMGVALSHDFAKSRVIFLSYASGKPSENSTSIYRARLSGHKLEAGRTIYSSTPKDTGSHFGGRMVALADGSLFLTLGDGFAYREQAQTLDNTLGKIIRIAADGNTLPDNPFANREDALPEIFSYGHRNVQGLAFDAATGKLWAHEHGPAGGDELNLIKPGANYGWPLATTGKDYNRANITPFEELEGTEGFVFDWTPSIAPSGLTIYRGEAFPDWQGDAFVGALAGQSLWRINLDGTRAVGAERLLFELQSRVRDVKEDQDGTLLVLTESDDGGKLLRISPK